MTLSRPAPRKDRDAPRPSEVIVERVYTLSKGVTAASIRKLVTQFAVGDLHDISSGRDRIAQELRSDLIGALRSVYSFADEEGKYSYRSLSQFESHAGRRALRVFELNLDARFNWEKLLVRSDGSQVKVRATAFSRDKAVASVEEAVLILALSSPGSVPVDRPSARPATRYDAFISHASEDAASVARPLHEALQRRGYRVWLDRFALRVGDSLRERIDDALVRSRHGIVVLSPSFFSKRKTWTKRELDGLFSKEAVERKRTILPVLHDLRSRELTKYSPMLAGRLAASTEHGVETVARELVAAMGAPLRSRTARGSRPATARSRSSQVILR